jgi:hypothetical protein
MTTGEGGINRSMISPLDRVLALWQATRETVSDEGYKHYQAVEWIGTT